MSRQEDTKHESEVELCEMVGKQQERELLLNVVAKASSQANGAAISDAQLAMKHVILILGGSAIATITLLGALIAKDALNLFPGLLEATLNALYWFAIGLIPAIGVNLCAYLINFFNAGAMAQSFFTTLDGTSDDNRIDEWERNSWLKYLRYVAFALFFIALGFFAKGGYTLSEAIFNLDFTKLN